MINELKSFFICVLCTLRLKLFVKFEKNFLSSKDNHKHTRMQNDILKVFVSQA